MGASGGLMLRGFSTLVSSYTQAQAIKGQAAYRKGRLETNALLADFQAEDAVKRGDKAATEVRRQARVVKGAQRASYAGQGVSVNDGSAADVQDLSQTLGELDALTVRTNAFREAFGYKVAAQDYRGQAQYTEMAGRHAANMTLLTGGLNALGFGFDAGMAYGGMGSFSDAGASSAKFGRMGSYTGGYIPE